MKILALKIGILGLLIIPNLIQADRDAVGGGAVPALAECNKTSIGPTNCSDSASCAGQRFQACFDNSDRGFAKDIYCVDGVLGSPCSSACGGISIKDAESQEKCKEPKAVVPAA